MLTGYFLRAGHGLHQLLPWNLRSWIGAPHGAGHCPVTYYAPSGRPVSLECECGRIFYRHKSIPLHLDLSEPPPGTEWVRE